jgi:hypothetical protein
VNIVFVCLHFRVRIKAASMVVNMLSQMYDVDKVHENSIVVKRSIRHRVKHYLFSFIYSCS